MALPLLAVGAAFVLAAELPLWTMLLGPIVLGVPHVVGDLRVLWLQRPSRIDANTMLAIAAPIAALTLARVAALVGAPGVPRIELGCGLLAIAVGAVVGARSAAARASWSLAIVGVGAAAMTAPALAVVLVAHAHNLVAVVWLAARGGSVVLSWLVVVALGIAVLAALPGGAETACAGNLTWARCVRDLAPGLDAVVADRLVRVFVFAQVVHYVLWTFVLPRQRGGSWRQDLGRRGAIVATAAGAVIVLFGLVDAAAARSTYLSFAIGHGWFEFAVGAFVLARRGAAT